MLQKKFLGQILNTKNFEVNCVDEGINLIKERMWSKMILAVLDDLDHMNQLHALARDRSRFGSGSLIIFTTRDRHLLSGLKEEEKYNAKLLNDHESVQLFSCHAFNSHFPPQEYIKPVQDIVRYAGGLPLALVTIGSHLKGRSLEEWGYEFKKLRVIPHNDIQKILKISFDGLDYDTQNVFLDIVCAFRGYSIKEVTMTLNACGFYSESAIATLVQKQLLQAAYSHLVMHDLVCDMGREIVRMESPRDPGRGSRLYIPQEVHDVLQGHKGSKRVEVMVVDPEALKGVNISTEAFKKMKNLRVLKIDELHISGKFELLFKELRWLSWKKCPLKFVPSDFSAEKLVALDMQGSNMQEFSVNMQYFRSLKKLDLSHCKRLRRTPNFNGSRGLEILLLGGCSSMTKIHSSIGNLDRLIYLYLSGCKKLKDLPSSICHLKSLECLDIDGCSFIQTLPVDLGDIRGLKKLYAHNTGVRQLPGSIEMLENLEILEVEGMNFAKRSIFQRTVNRIQSLPAFVQQLSLSNCNLFESDIPKGIGSLTSLKFLDLSGNNFHYLPFDFSVLKLLRSLILSDCENLQVLPSISNLGHLRILSLANCKRLVKIIGMDNLPCIEEIDMLNCSSLSNPVNEGFFRAPALAFQSFKGRTMDLNIYLQCNEVPDWFSNQVTSPSICFIVPSHEGYKFIGVILWLVGKFVGIEPCSYRMNGLCAVSGIHQPFNELIPDGQRELSCVCYRSNNLMVTSLDGQRMNGGEKIEVGGLLEENFVKKIGIHLLYLDQEGKVTSFPAIMDPCDQMKRRGKNGISEALLLEHIKFILDQKTVLQMPVPK